MKGFTLFFASLFLVSGMAMSVNAQNCVADYTYQQSPGGSTSPLQFEFTNTSSTPNNLGSYTLKIEQIVSPSNIVFIGSFNIGNPGTSTYYTFSVPGNYLVTLKMIDSMTSPPFDYCWDTTAYLIAVDTPTCAVSFDTTQVTINANGDYEVTFEAIPQTGSGANNVYSWDFGDGSTGSGNPVTHTFQGQNNYSVSLSSSDTNCSYTLTKYYQFYSCAGFQASYIISPPVNYNTFTFTNTSNYPSGSSPNAWVSAHWVFGDGSSMYGNPSVTHTYAQPGTYTSGMTVFLTDSLPNGGVAFCTDSLYQQVTVSMPNEISGYIIANDTTLNNPAYTYKIWLIQYDSLQDWLYAVDSQVINSSTSGTFYQFTDHLPGIYYVKAHELTGEPTSNNEVMLPTYHLSSLDWTNATPILHGGGATQWKSVHMLAGNNYSGPGFVGGNVSQGANRPTGNENNGAAAVAGLAVFLKDRHNPEVLFYTLTDEYGDFSFEDIPFGVYEIYPEALNFSTSPSEVTINEGAPTSTGNDFEQTSDQIRPKGNTSIKETRPAPFKIYPNPTADQLHIEWQTNQKEGSLSVWDIYGRQVITSDRQVNNIDLSGLADGTYYIRVRQASGAEYVQKFAKQSQ